MFNKFYCHQKIINDVDSMCERLTVTKHVNRTHVFSLNFMSISHKKVILMRINIIFSGSCRKENTRDIKK